MFAPLDGFDEPCPAHQKRCGDKCVGLSDPSTGCARLGCEPCASSGEIAVCEGGRCVAPECTDGLADCDDSPTNGCEVVLRSDPDNCGGCGRHCCGGTCEDSECQSKLLAENQDRAMSFTLDGTRLYWIQKDAVMTVSTDGKDNPTRLSTADSELAALAVGESRLFFGGYNTNLLYTDRVRGGEGEQLHSASENDGTLHIALTEKFAFSLTVDQRSWFGNAVADAKLLKFAIEGSSSSTIFGELRKPRGLAADDQNVYFVTESMADLYTRYWYTLRSVPLEGTDATILADDLSSPAGLVVNESYLYWLDLGKLFRIRTDGTDGAVPTEVANYAMQQGGRGDIAVDDKQVFFMDKGSKTLNQIPKDQSGVSVDWLVEADGFGEIEVDESCLYWTNEKGEIRVLAK